MKTSSKIILGLIAGITLCIILEIFKIDGVGLFLKILAFSLAGYFMIQMILNEGLKISSFEFIQRLLNLGMSICTVGILFRFLYWFGWRNELNVGLFIIGVSGIFILFKWNALKKAGETAFNLFKINYLLPMAFLLILSVIAIATPDKTFYETFSILSKTQTYEQFMAERASHMHSSNQENY
jgi:hypothetical protein